MPSARILVVDDDPAIRKIVCDRLASRGYDVATAADGHEALTRISRFEPHLVILDLRMPELDGFGVLEALPPPRPAVLVITAHGTIDAAVKAMKMGASDFISKPFDAQHLEHLVARTLETVRLVEKVERLQTELSTRHTLVKGESPSMDAALRLATRAAASDTTILLRGESGTGKELLARYVHRESARGGGPFVAVNCATLSAQLLESDLFGHEKGAFTGAVQSKPGRIEIAAGGTLFLDEIAELSPELQAKLLRVLQEREFERVGGTKMIAADVRIVAATHRNLSAAIQAGTFREDLFYRLNVIAITVPPLRERSQDLPALVRFFIARHCTEVGREAMRISDAALDLLQRYAWPGNVRELSNVMERAVVLAPGESIGPDDLPEEIREACDAGATTARGFHELVRGAKREIIKNALRKTGGHQTRAADALGLSQPYLARLIKRLGAPKE